MVTFTLIEIMPLHLRASHIAAGNDGVYPANGAERVYVVGHVGSNWLHPRWARVVEDSIRDGDLPDDADVRHIIPDEALAPVVDPEEAAACRGDYLMDQARDDRATGDR